MANEQQLQLLKSGVNTWNAWRNNNSEVSIDLFEANLSGARLYRADLGGAVVDGDTYELLA